MMALRIGDHSSAGLWGSPDLKAASDKVVKLL